MLSTKFKASCEHYGCSECIEFDVNWEDVTIDLNQKTINIPFAGLLDAGWSHRKRRETYSDSDSVYHTFKCPAHKEEEFYNP